MKALATKALEYIPDGAVVGLGSGRAATAFIHELGERVRGGLRVRGIATSEASTKLAEQLGIPLRTLGEVAAIDVDVDGADEVDPHLNLIKGYGGALVREKIVAAASQRIVILVGEEKLVAALGSRGRLPIEVVPFGLASCRRALAALGCPARPRMTGAEIFVSDNGNYILDCEIRPLDKPDEFERTLRAIPGVVATGLFLGMAHTVLVQRGDQIEVRERCQN